LRQLLSALCVQLKWVFSALFSAFPSCGSFFVPLARIAGDVFQLVHTPHSVPETSGIGTETAKDSQGRICMSGRSSALLRIMGSLVIAILLGFGISRLEGKHFSSLK
jgi:hypothetical protein